MCLQKYKVTKHSQGLEGRSLSLQVTVSTMSRMSRAFLGEGGRECVLDETAYAKALCSQKSWWHRQPEAGPQSGNSQHPSLRPDPGLPRLPPMPQSPEAFTSRKAVVPSGPDAICSLSKTYPERDRDSRGALRAWMVPGGGKWQRSTGPGSKESLKWWFLFLWL